MSHMNLFLFADTAMHYMSLYMFADGVENSVFTYVGPLVGVRDRTTYTQHPKSAPLRLMLTRPQVHTSRVGIFCALWHDHPRGLDNDTAGT